MRTQAITYGVLEPISVQDVKDYARIASGNLEDGLIQSLIGAARKQCEEFARMSISPREWRTTFRLPSYTRYGFGLGGSWHDPENVISGFTLPRGPILEFMELNWGTHTGTVAAKGYAYIESSQKVVWTEEYPHPPTGAVSLIASYKAGFAPNEAKHPTMCLAPDDVRLAVTILASHLYENRAMEGQEIMPSRVQQLLRGWWSSISVA